MKIRRVVIGMDAGAPGADLLSAAAELAGRMEAELVGLFVEDIGLLHFAGLPFAREVGVASATRRDLDPERMARSLRAVEREAQRLLAESAARCAVRFSFSVARGFPAAELLARAREADLVIMRLQQPADVARSEGVRVVEAGDMDELHAALRDDSGRILVLAGGDRARLRETVRGMLRRIDG